MDVRGVKIVVIGGGTGSFALLSGLKHYVSHITAIVNMADDGGSTGELRDEFGVLPPGDVRQCLVALSESPRVRDLFNYRYTKGAFKGHAFGNLFLSTLEEITGSFVEAVDVADEVLNVRGSVVPATLDNVKLVMRQRHGRDITGQFEIGNTPFGEGEERPGLYLIPHASINPDAAVAIETADMVVIAPGNLYGSLAPAMIVGGMREALETSRGKIVYVCNLVTKPGQTDGFLVHDFADEIERFIGAPVLDYVLYNTEQPSRELLEKYARDKEYGVDFDTEALRDAHYEAIGKKLISNERPVFATSDKIASSRSFIRHDGDTVARQIMRLYFN